MEREGETHPHTHVHRHTEECTVHQSFLFNRYYLEKLGVSDDCLLLKVSYKSVTKPWTNQVRDEEHIHKDTWKIIKKKKK